MVQKGSGNFEVVEGGAAVVTGRLYVPEDINKEMVNISDLDDSMENDASSDSLPLTDKDVYKELRLRGYNYKGMFKCITKTNNKGKSLHTIYRERRNGCIYNYFNTTLNK